MVVGGGCDHVLRAAGTAALDHAPVPGTVDIAVSHELRHRADDGGICNAVPGYGVFIQRSASGADVYDPDFLSGGGIANGGAGNHPLQPAVPSGYLFSEGGPLWDGSKRPGTYCMYGVCSWFLCFGGYGVQDESEEFPALYLRDQTWILSK